MAKKQALGKGLGALLSDAPERVVTVKRTDSPPIIGRMAGNVALLTISQIEANKDQPRKDFDDAPLQELAISLRELGIIQPITVHKVRADKYQIISGERRFRAAQLANLEEIPAYIREANDQTLLEMALVENIQREDLHAIEIAVSFQRLIEECNLTHEELGNRLGKNRSTITNYVRLLQLPGPMQIAVRTKQISMGHARALIAIDDAAWQQKVFNRILKDRLSVRQVEELAQVKKKQSASTKRSVLTFDEQKVQADLRLKFGKNIQLKSGFGGKGKIEIPYASSEELDALLQKWGI
ncbi:ParB/RepB/Spo0J family partition protein [Flavobacteriales bacterium]|nr:ParB/RepB/Spo0J family partition protein [Flavobacteriales bacterium]